MQSLPIDIIRTNGGTQARATLDAETVSAYASDMAAGAEFPPLTVFYDGTEYWLADGFHRLAARVESGAEDAECDIKQGGQRDAVLFACGANATNGLRRTNADKRRAVELLLADDEWSKRSDRWIAQKCGVGHVLVNRMRPTTVSKEQLNQPRIGQDGKTRRQPEPTDRSEPAPKDEAPPQNDSMEYDEEQEEEPAHNHRTACSGENEWYTPAPFIEAARKVMGSIDTDPASCELANETVKAERYCTAQENGLEQVWRGNVWMNPPYAQPLIRQFAEAVSEKWRNREFMQAIVLVNNATETGWFQAMARAASAICLLKGRIKFIDKTGAASFAPIQGQAVLYYGEDAVRFLNVFGEMGVVAEFHHDG